MPKLFLDWMFELNVCINCNKQEFLTVGNFHKYFMFTVTLKEHFGIETTS